MKVVEKTVVLEEYDGIAERSKLIITVNGEEVASFLEGEPEDANFSRDYSDVYLISSLMAKAHTAGKNGEPFELNFEETKEEF